METATLPPPAALPRELGSKRRLTPYAVELLESLDDTIESYIDNFGGSNFNGEAIEEENEDDDVLVATNVADKNRRASGSSVKSGGSGAHPGNDAGSRLLRKKRPHRDRAYSVSEGGKFGSGTNFSTASGPARVLKNCRKSRNGFGRGLPKKGRPPLSPACLVTPST